MGGAEGEGYCCFILGETLSGVGKENVDIGEVLSQVRDGSCSKGAHDVFYRILSDGDDGVKLLEGMDCRDRIDHHGTRYLHLLVLITVRLAFDTSMKSLAVLL